LNSFTSVRRWPKRGYAIVRCALDMGLRSCEIAHLMISDIDWRSGTVTLRGTKSLRQDILPLPVETGQALADYLQHERPTSSHPGHLLRHRGAHDQPVTSSTIQRVIKWACRRAGLMDFSAHSLRHTLACRLVENGSSLKEVADVLRHRSLNTTLIYAKLDTPKLSTVAAAMARESIMSARISLQQQESTTILPNVIGSGFELHSRDTLLAGFARYVASQHHRGPL
jgi:integrase